MIIYPAIDLRKGKIVRLYQGDYASETIYQDDPLKTAQQYKNAGAEWLHVVDLDAAKNPSSSQYTLIQTLIESSGLNVQVGGGIRTKEQVVQLFEMGAKRIIVGSLAVTAPNDIKDWFSYFGAEKLVLALDVVAKPNELPLVAINAWQQITRYSFFDIVRFYQSVSIKHVLCTSISLDGTMSGPDLALYEDILNEFPFLALQASGGICSTQDIKRLKNQGLAGAIIGRALYENQLTLPEVLSC